MSGIVVWKILHKLGHILDVNKLFLRESLPRTIRMCSNLHFEDFNAIKNYVLVNFLTGILLHAIIIIIKSPLNDNWTESTVQICSQTRELAKITIRYLNNHSGNMKNK